MYKIKANAEESYNFFLLQVFMAFFCVSPKMTEDFVRGKLK